MCNWCEYLDENPTVQAEIITQIVVAEWRADSNLRNKGHVCLDGKDVSQQVTAAKIQEYYNIVHPDPKLCWCGLTEGFCNHA